RPSGVHVGVGLHGEGGVEGAELGALALAAVGVVGGGVVAHQHQLDALQAVAAPALRPAAVVADQHAEDGGTPFARAADGGGAEVAMREIALLELLVALARADLLAAGEVDVAVLAEDRAIGADGDCAGEAVAGLSELGVAEVEADAER